jgi:hypothetical protein
MSPRRKRQPPDMQLQHELSDTQHSGKVWRPLQNVVDMFHWAHWARFGPADDRTVLDFWMEKRLVVPGAQAYHAKIE